MTTRSVQEIAAWLCAAAAEILEVSPGEITPESELAALVTRNA